MGTNITLEAIPADGFKKWTGQAVSGNTETNPLTLKLDSKNMQIVAHFNPAPTMYTLTTGVEGDGTISPDTQEYEDGTVVPITATPASGWHFKGWKEGKGYSSPVDGSIEMNRDKTVIAIFEKDTEPEPEVIKYTLTTGVEGEGTISPSTQEYEEGTEVDITATAADGWHFKGWKEEEGYSSPVDGSITMDGHKHVVAIFEQDVVPEPEVIKYTLNTGVEGEGTISPDTQEYEEGTVVAITATPASGWHFKGWKDTDGYFSPVDGSITMDGDKNVVAIFEKDAEPEPEKIMYTLTIGVEGEGAISPDTQQYEEGTVVTITATPAAGWHFKGWKEEEGYSSPVDGSITMDGDKNIVAIFEKDAEPEPEKTIYTLTTGVEGNGTISPGTQEYEDGTVVAITATPASGWRFIGWKEGEGYFSPVDGSITMDGNKTVVARFARNSAPSSNNSPSSPEPSDTPEEEQIVDIPTEAIPEGSIDIDSDNTAQDEDTITLDSEAIPEGDALPESLPQTGGIPAGSLYGLGGILAAAGIYLRKKYK